MSRTSWLSSLKPSRRRRARKTDRNSSRLASTRRGLFEPLEDRRLLAITGLITGTNVDFTGDATADTATLTVDGGGYLALNGSTDLDGDTNPNDLLVANVTGLTYNDAGLNDTVTFSGSNPFSFNNAAFTALSVTAQTINVGGGAAIDTVGSGAISLNADRNIVLSSGSSLTTVDGGITLSALGTPPPTPTSFIGIWATNSSLQTTGDGDVALTGTGGNSDIGTGGVNRGIHFTGSSVSSTKVGANAGTIELNGTGSPYGRANQGVQLGSDSSLTSVDGDILITGRGARFGNGVDLKDSTVTSTGTGNDAATITLDGALIVDGTTAAGTGVNLGGALDITSVDGDILIVGIGGNGQKDSRNFDAVLNDGVILGSSTVRSTGVGPDAAKITINGTGGSGGRSSYGVDMLNAAGTVTSVDGDIEIIGKGGGGLSENNNRGVNLTGIESTGAGPNAATITIDGTGGSITLFGSDGSDHGVSLFGDKAVTSVDGDVSITGTAGNSNFSYGVLLIQEATVDVKSAKLTVTGTSGPRSRRPGRAFQDVPSVWINSGQLLSGSGELQVNAYSTPQYFASISFLRTGAGSSTIGGVMATAAITINADEVEFGGTLNVQSTSDLTIQPVAADTTVGLGGGAGTLNLTDTELALLHDGFNSITIGDVAAGTGTVNIDTATFLDPVTIAGGTINDNLGTDITAPSATLDGNVAPGLAAGILNVSGDFAFADGDNFTVQFGGTSPGTASNNHDQLDVAGPVTIGAGVTLNTVQLSGFAPTQADMFTIVNNDGSDAVVGTFAGLAEGATISNFLGSGLSAQITYVGGDGNDVVLTAGPSNSPPVVAADVAAVSADEGGMVANAGSFSDAQGNATVTLTASLGAVTKNDANGTWSWSLNVADGPAGPTTVTVTATDDQNAAVNTTFTYAVDNVAPTIALSGDATVNEGSPYTLNLGVVTDPGQDAITGYKIEWGDGDIDTFTGDPANTMATHTYADGPATQTHDVRVTDEDGTFLAGSLSVIVKNVAPTVILSGPTMANEGETKSYSFTVSDPGDDTFTLESISSGTNGVLSNTLFNGVTGAGSFDILYPDGPASSDVTVQVRDSDGDLGNTALITVAIANLAPTTPVDDDSANDEVTENAATNTLVGVTAVSSDAGVNDTVTFSLTDDADGRFQIDPDTGVVTVLDGSLLDYEDATSHEITVQASDGQGGTSSQTFTIDLLNETATISGTVFVDADGDGLFDGGTETGLDGVTVELLDSAFALLDSDTTSMGGVYGFTVDDEFASYVIRETQPTGVDDGAAILGDADGNAVTGEPVDGTVLSPNEIELTLTGIDASDYDFTEVGQAVQAGDTATIGFWQNKNGQKLINEGGAALVTWLNANFGNILGDTFSDGVGGDDDAEVASFYKNEFFKKKLKGTSKVDAQFMSTALATFFTSSNLSGGSVAASYGFTVTETGIGTKVVNVGSSGAAFGVADNTDMTIMALLLATNVLTGADNGSNDGVTDTDDNAYSNVYDTNGDGILDDAEKELRGMANSVYSGINEDGDI